MRERKREGLKKIKTNARESKDVGGKMNNNSGGREKRASGKTFRNIATSSARVFVDGESE